MLQELFLHIGHMKTGTSSIQETCRTNAATLATHGVFYEAGGRNHHRYGLSFRPTNLDWVVGQVEQAVARMEGGLQRTELPKALISTENLTALGDRHAKECVNRLRAFARKVTVVVYVRHPVSYANSCVPQLVRHGRDLAEVLERPPRLQLKALLKRWDRAADGDIVVRPFDRAQLANGDAVDDILAIMGIPDAGPKLKKVRVNEALSPLGILVLDAANRTRGRPVSRAVLPAFDRIAGPSFVLPQAALDLLTAEAAPELEFVTRRYGLHLPEPRLTPTPLPELDGAALESLGEVLAQLLAFARAVDETTVSRALGIRPPFVRKPVGPRSRTERVARALGLRKRLLPRQLKKFR